MAFTLNDGTGIDMTVNGTYVLNGTQPSGTGTVEILSLGIARVDANTAPGDADNFAHGNANVNFRTGSIYEWNTNTFTPSWSGLTYFTPTEAVVFRFSQPPNFDLGGGSLTTIYGVVEANANIELAFAGDKIFVYGIAGSGNITSDVTFTGDIIINGLVAALGGTGGLTLPPLPSVLEIGSAGGTTLTVVNDKTVTGNISLISTNTFVELGANDLTVTGTISGGGTNAYIRTNGTGVLTLNTVDAVGKTLPIGNTSYNPLVITNGNNENYSARVETGIVPAIAFPAAGINRTWNIFASSVTPGVTVTFQYAAVDANPGVLPTNNMEILLYSGAAWNIIPGNNNIPAVGADPYTITSTTALIINNITIPYALGKAGGYALPLDYFITARAQKNGSSGIISWNVFSTDNVLNFEVQRSVNGSAFETIAVFDPAPGQLAYSFTDIVLEKGTILYRIRVNRNSGGTRYSNTVAIINDTKGLLITSMSPNPVDQNAVISLSAAKHGSATFEVYQYSEDIK